MADENGAFITEPDDDAYWYNYDDDIAQSNDLFQTSNSGAKEMAKTTYHIYDVESQQSHFETTEFTENEDFSKHNLILKDVINDQGLVVQSYSCQQCCEEYNDINEFLYKHPDTELLNDNPNEEPTFTENGENDMVSDVDDFIEVDEEEDVQDDLLEDLVEETESNDEADLAENNDDDDEEHTVTNQAVNEFESLPDDSSKAEPLDADNERYYCYECQQVFTDLASAEEHNCLLPQQNEENDGNEIDEFVDHNNFLPSQQQDGLESIESEHFDCAFCQQIFNSYNELLNHITNCEENAMVPSNTKRSKYQCEVCKKECTSLRTYTNHQRMHKKMKNIEEPVQCEICNTFFASPKNLKLHRKMHKERSLKTIQEALPAGALPEYSDLNQFFCEICNKSFDQKLLVIHKNMHQNVEEYNCGKCNKQFTNMVDYEMHLQMHTETGGNSIKHKLAANLDQSANTDNRLKYACQYCGKAFQRPYEKVKHERVHTGEKPYNCEVCGKTFRVSYSLTLHLRNHTDIRPYVCATCNKRFKQQSVYQHHLKTHNVERGYKCDECGKSFRTSVQLCGHKNSHKKPYSCNECNRPFSSMYAVKIHMKTHNKTSKTNKNLKNRCDICGATYARLFALRYHLKEQHGIEVEPGDLLETEHSSIISNNMDAETAILMNAANEAQLGDEYNAENQQGGSKTTMHNNDDIDETVAATQTIMQNEEIIVDNFHPEEVITDWLK